MKSLKESLLSINEAINKNAKGFVVIFEHESPDDTDIIKVSGNLKKAENELENKISNDFMIYTSNLKPGLYYISHDDEQCLIKNLGVKSENDLWDKIWKQYESYMKENNYQYGEWVEVFSEDPKYDLLNIFDFEADKAPNNKAELKKLIYERVRESYIDSDSESAIVVVDVMNEKILFGGGMDITFYDGTVDDYIKEFFDDEDDEDYTWDDDITRDKDHIVIVHNEEGEAKQLFFTPPKFYGCTHVIIEKLKTGERTDSLLPKTEFKEVIAILDGKKPSNTFINPRDNVQYLYVSPMNIGVIDEDGELSFSLGTKEREELIKWLKDNM